MTRRLSRSFLLSSGWVRCESRALAQSETLVRCLREQARDTKRIGMETGPTAGVLFRTVQVASLPAVCLEAWHAHREVAARTKKTHRNDARRLAELMLAGWFRAA